MRFYHSPSPPSTAGLTAMVLPLLLLLPSTTTASGNNFPPPFPPTTQASTPSLPELLTIKARALTFRLLNRGASGVDCACAIIPKLPGEYDFHEKLRQGGSSQEYLAEAQRHFSRTDYRLPRCIVVPRGAGAGVVARVVAVVDACGAVFAVRGGGHMTPPGFSNIDDGVLISLSQMKQLQLNAAAAAAGNAAVSTVDVGPGNRWGDVSRYLTPRGFIAVGGRVSTVGVPGVVLGGGISYHTSKYGFAMDNVEEYEVVLADARVVVATPRNMHKDLYWALRGGSSNFGIVTRFRLLAHPTVPKVWISQSFIPVGPDAEGKRPVLAKFLDQLQDYVEAEDRDSAVLPVFMNVPMAGGDVINLSLTSDSVDQSLPHGAGFVVTNATSVPPQIAPDLAAVPPIFKAIISEMPVLQGVWNVTVQGALAELVAAGTPDGLSHSWRVGSCVATREASEIITRVLYSRTPLLTSDVFKDSPESYAATSLAIQLISKSALEYGEARHGGNTFGIPSSTPYFWYILTNSWLGAPHDDAVNAWGEETLRLINQELQKAGLLHPFIYMNDASKEQEGTGGKVFETYGKDELKRLKKIAKVYDPKQLWKKGLVGGYKLPA